MFGWKDRREKKMSLCPRGPMILDSSTNGKLSALLPFLYIIINMPLKKLLKNDENDYKVDS